MSEKLQKVLARAGLGSRRELEGWISANRVSVDGKIASLGDRVSEDAKIRVDGNLLKLTKESEIRRRVLVYNKPVGEMCTRKDPKNRPTVFDRLPNLKQGRWVAIGRLDYNTCGLLLFTNDGEMANRMMHPSSEIEREYAVRIHGEVNEATIKILQEGVMLDDGKAAFDSIKAAGGEGTNQWFHVTLKEGRNREVRRLWESQDVEVSRLIRVRYGAVELPRSLHRGTWIDMEDQDINKLASTVDLKPKSPPRKKVQTRAPRQTRMATRRKRATRKPN
jgi:23S rRNA pseudouridine2605 synthase